MKPTQEQVIAWAQEAGAVHYSPPPLRAIRGMSMTFEQMEAAFALAYEAGRKDENEAFEKELSKEDPEWLDDEAFHIVTKLLEWARVRREQ